MRRLQRVSGLLAVLVLLGGCQKFIEKVGRAAMAANESASSTEAVTAPQLCGLEPAGYTAHFVPDAGNFEDSLLDIPPGANGVRLDGQFVTFKETTKWNPSLGLIFKTQPQQTYKLRFNKYKRDTLIRIETETDAGMDYNQPEYDFDANPKLNGPLRADVSWTPDGTFTTTIYNTPEGFAGPGEVHVYKGAAPHAVEIVGSSADIDVNSLRFGHVCRTGETPEIDAPPRVAPAATNPTVPASVRPRIRIASSSSASDDGSASASQ